MGWVGDVWFDLGQDLARLDRQAGRTHAEALADLQDQAGDGGVQVEVLVRIDVVQRQARGGEGLELGGDLGLELTAGGGIEE